MGVAGNEIVRFTPEAVRGTTPGTPSWTTLDLHGEGLRMQEARSAFEGHFSSTFPQMTRVVKTGRTQAGKLVTPVFAANAQVMLEMALKRTAGVLDSFTFQKKKVSGEERGYLGCVCDTLTIRFAADDDPVIFDYDWVALSSASASSVSAGSYPSGTPFMGHRTVVTVNAQPFKNLSGEVIIANNLIVGPPGSDGNPIFIKDGVRRVGLSLRESYEAALIAAILRAEAAVTVKIEFFTGVGTQELELEMKEMQIVEAPEEAASQGDNVEQPVTAVAQKPAAQDDIKPTYVTS